MAAKKNPEGCGSIKVVGCHQKICSSLHIVGEISAAACETVEIDQDIFLKAKDPANQNYEWEAKFVVMCLQPPGPPCRSQDVTFQLKCVNGEWDGYLNTVLMGKTIGSRCSPISLSFNGSNPGNCNTTGVEIAVTEIPDDE